MGKGGAGLQVTQHHHQLSAGSPQLPSGDFSWLWNPSVGMGMEEEGKSRALTGALLRYSEKYLSWTNPEYRKILV